MCWWEWAISKKIEREGRHCTNRDLDVDRQEERPFATEVWVILLDTAAATMVSLIQPHFHRYRHKPLGPPRHSKHECEQITVAVYRLRRKTDGAEGKENLGDITLSPFRNRVEYSSPPSDYWRMSSRAKRLEALECGKMEVAENILLKFKWIPNRYPRSDKRRVRGKKQLWEHHHHPALKNVGRGEKGVLSRDRDLSYIIKIHRFAVPLSEQPPALEN